jgi:uncharacterized protein YndB with AHSA1/START domain
MPHAENTVIIERPVEDVFAYLADGTNNPHWRSGVVSIERAPGDEGVGAVYRQVLTGPGGRKIAGDYEVTAYERPHRLAFQVIAGPARPTGEFTLAPAGAGRTRVTFTLDLTPTGLMRVMSGMIAKTMRAEVDQLTRLKAVLEKSG